jgi:hypothetical protein
MDLLWSVIFASALALGLSGCLGPEGSRVTSGQKFSPEALAFLNDPRTTREQVLAELGEPQVEFPLMRTLVYLRRELPRHLAVQPKDPGESGDSKSSVENGSEEEWALLIAYDERGLIVAHADRHIDANSLEKECADWNAHRAKKTR